MKSMTSKMKDESFKTRNEIDALIQKIEEDDATSPDTSSLSLPVSPPGNGPLVDKEYYLGNLFPMIEHYLPEETQLTDVEKVELTKGVQRKLTGLAANMPITCYGDKCPFKESCPLYSMGKAPEGLNCHLAGDRIKTSLHGDIPIEDLDEEIHTLVSYNRRRDSIKCDNKHLNKAGRSFKKYVTNYVGNTFHIETATGKDNNLTSNHISIAKWNESAINKPCVYLMEKNGRYRVGKSKLLSYNEKASKYHMPVLGRLNTENADRLWILGYYDHESDALLAEEYFSIVLGAPKALFIATSKEYSNRKKYEGLYKWVEQETLDRHHERFLKPSCYWANMLSELGLSLEYPFIEKNNSEKTYDEIKVFANRSMMIRACNLLPGVMSVPVYPEKEIRNANKRHKLVSWEKISRIDVKKEEVDVYSLDVEKEKTYFANNIATHNCPLEAMILDLYTRRYLDEFEVEADDFSEVTTMSMLAATHIMEMRGFMAIGRDEDNQSPDGIIKNVVGFTPDEEPITQYQEHPGYAIIERAWRWRTKLLESLGATRKEKNKKGANDMDNFKSLSQAAASLRSKIDKLTIIDVTEG